MREISAITDELTKAAAKIGDKKKSLDAANEAQATASKEFDDAQIEAATLRDELNNSLNLLVPTSIQGRVRQSH